MFGRLGDDGDGDDGAELRGNRTGRGVDTCTGADLEQGCPLHTGSEH